MRRCFDLAKLGAQTVSPNPMVGAVIVHDNRIIGEGFHRTRGEAHAEVNAINSVSGNDKPKLAGSTIYISLEPCSHQGLTPPCTDLILSSGMKQVVISVIDPNPEVHGEGIERLRKQGISVLTGVLAEEGNQLLANFRSVMTQHRPYVILKFVQSSDRIIGHPDYQVWLSNKFEKILVHKLRSEVDGIMVGTNTVLIDNPQLTNRMYFGKNPVRIAFDRTMRLPKDLHLFDGAIQTLIYTETRHQNLDSPSKNVAQANGKSNDHVEYIFMQFDDNMLENCLTDLRKRNIQSVLVEGGASLINSFVKHDLWDEAWVVTTHHTLNKGVKAPLVHGQLVQKFNLETDEIIIIRRNST